MSVVSVILLDDDPFVRDVVSAALNSEPGVHVRCFAKAPEALAGARIWPPDVVVLDFTLPGTDGLAVLGDLRDLLSPLPPVIFLTAHEDAGIVASLRAEGAGVIAKSLGPVAIAAEILRHGVLDQAPRDSRLDGVAARFRASLPRTMSEIDEEWNTLRQGWQHPVAASLLMRVHKLAGAAGLFKLYDLALAARAVEAAVQEQLAADEPGAAMNVAAIEESVVKLRAAAGGASRTVPPGDFQ